MITSLLARIVATVVVVAVILIAVFVGARRGAEAEMRQTVERSTQASKIVRAETNEATVRAGSLHQQTRADLTERLQHGSTQILATAGADAPIDPALARVWVGQLASLRERASTGAPAGDAGSSADPP